MPNWKRIKAEYISGGTSYRKLAEKYGVSFNTLSQIGKREKWTDLKRQTYDKITTKISKSVAEKEGERYDRLLTVTDNLLEKIEYGIASGNLAFDAQSIKQLTGALKDIRDIKGLKTELDRQEQKARIAKLQSEAAHEEESRDIVVKIESGAEEYAQ